MKVLHINSYYSVNKLYKNLYDKQIEQGIALDVFVPISSQKKQIDNDMGDYTTISVNHCEFDRYIFHMKHHKIYKDIIKTYNINEYSLIHAHSLFSNGYIAMKLKEKYNIPYVVAVRNTDVNVFFKKIFFLKKLGIKILAKADKVIFLSQGYRDFVIDKYVPNYFKDKVLKKTSIIPNGIDDFWINNKGEGKDLQDKSKLRLLYVGTVDKNKNITTTIKAIKVLQKKGLEVSYTIVGGIRNQSIYNKIKDLSFVTYISPKTKEELIEIYRDNDIFVMPSITETFGLVYPEAMSQGLPVIYTKGQGFDGQLEDGEVGYSVNCFDAIQIAEKIEQIINNYNIISRNAIQHSSKFRWSLISHQYEEIYSDCLNN